MDSETTHLPNLPAPTDEEWARLQPLLEKAKAEGNPWAAAAGISRNDPTFDEWVEIMRENRRKADEDGEAVMSTKVEIIYPAPLPPMTAEERAASEKIIAEAIAKGHPLATLAGTLPDDELTNEWLAAMREYRREVEEDPNY